MRLCDHSTGLLQSPTAAEYPMLPYIVGHVRIDNPSLLSEPIILHCRAT